MTRDPFACELIAMAGEALYGRAWQSPLAAELGVALRTMQRIAAAAAAGDDYRIAPGLLDDVDIKLAARAKEIAHAQALLEGFAK